MLKHNEVNPLNVFGLRRLDHCPPHFETLLFDLRTQEKEITDWIYENLAGRFYFDDRYIVNEKGQLSLCKCVAFEDASELTYFAMFMGTINQNEHINLI